MRIHLALVLGLVVFSACATDTEPTPSLEPSGPVGDGKSDGSCPNVPAFIQPTAPPQYSCGALQSQHQRIFDDVNRFWGSSITACSCGPDFPEGCDGAFSLFEHGYVWLGETFLAGLLASGSWSPIYYVMAHEVGHEIQGHYNAFAPTTQQRELTADCLAGYYLGSLSCRGLTSRTDIVIALRTACIIADGTGDPVRDRETHGTCDQRANALAAGIDAYYAGALPLTACAL